MSEFIGARISLISKSDIRYVGTLIEINSEDSTVALENVTSFGTEGRRDNVADEVAPSDSVYEYIVFRGSDVKDLRIEEQPKENEPPKPPQVPNDPAILGAGSRPQPHNGRPQQMQRGQNGFHQPPQYLPYQQQHYNQFAQQRFPGPPGVPPQGFQGPPGGFGYPGPYGPPPPGWYPPPGQGFLHPPGPFAPPHQQQQNYGAQGQQSMQPPPHSQKPSPQSLSGPPAQELESSTQIPSQIKSDVKEPAVPKPSKGSESAAPSINVDAVLQPTLSAAPLATPIVAAAAPRPPLETKPDAISALAPPAPAEQALTPTKGPPTGPRSGRIVPAMPLVSPALKNTVKAPTAQTGTEATASPSTNQNPTLQYQSSTQAATAAVAAAMAKLPPAVGQKPKPATDNDAMDNLTRKVNEMRTDERIRNGRQQAAGGYAVGNRGGRGGPRRGGREQAAKPMEVPATDFDFESANAKFNKQDLGKEAIAGGPPAGTPVDGEAPPFNGGDASQDASANGSGNMYSKSSFFDNISSEARDREDAPEGKRAPGGYEFRNEERRRNFETFGQGSVDNGYRGGFRGRGRGRAGFRGGRGAFTGPPRGGRGSYRGGSEETTAYQGAAAPV